MEDFLRDLAHANPNWRIAILRYFNPAGAHASGLIGEAPMGRPNNLVPLLCRIAAGEFSDLSIYGTDWPTPDGTGVRDYLHVQDLSLGHVAALRHLARNAGVVTLNLGLGRGRSVLDVVAAFETACGRRITRTLAPRRPGRRREQLCRSLARGKGARMARDTRPRRHLRRCLAVATARRTLLSGVMRSRQRALRS